MTDAKASENQQPEVDVSELRERLFQLKLRKMNELAEIRPNFDFASFSEGFNLTCPIFEELVEALKEIYKFETRQIDGLSFKGTSSKLSSEAIDKLNAWLEGR